MNRSYSATVVVPNRGCRSCRSRRRGCGRSLPSCPNCRRQTTSPDVIPWHRGNDGRLVARGHQRGILSIRSRNKLDIVKRQGETRRKRNGFVLSLPRGLSLARLARGDLSPWTKKNLINITPLQLDSDMTDLYELLVNMSLCEDEVEFPPYQRLASPPPCMEIDMEDLEEVSISREDSKPTPTETKTEEIEEPSKPTPSVESAEEEGEQQDAATEFVKDDPASSDSSDKDLETEKTALDSILTPLRQSTPILEEDLATILDSLLKHKTSDSTSSMEPDFPSVDRFLSIMEVISQLTETVMKPASTVSTEDSESNNNNSNKITTLTPQHLAVIMNLRSLLDYATKVLCIKSIETSAKDNVMMGGSGMEIVV
ncbi:hypothetical protein QBC43DRAFT_117173 [Cladorrhinum sp. PSN259]|nr:hypothetical protein QBC43DRAFT_117173 [Cladorrhinum sp. PSN259]